MIDATVRTSRPRVDPEVASVAGIGERRDDARRGQREPVDGRIGALGLPNYVDPAGRAVLQAMVTGRLRIRGIRHLTTLNRVTRLFSVV